MRKDFFVYVMLDQREKGQWIFNDIIFEYRPFYIGVGTGYRMTAHFLPSQLSKKSIKNNIINSIISSTNEFPIFYKIYENIESIEAHKIEVEFINKFGKIKDRSNNSFGILSNLTDGADGTSGYNHTEKYKNTLRKNVYQYDINGNFIKEWRCLKDVVSFYEMSGGAGVRLSMKGGGHCKGYLWSYIKVEKLEPNIRKCIAYNYSIYKDNTLIKEFKSKEEIDIFFDRKVSAGNISSCCSNRIKSYLGYQWNKTKINYE